MMTPQRAKELLPIITAFANGEEIECCQQYSERWMKLEDLNFTGDQSRYRIKPKPKLRAWKPEEAPKFVMLRAKGVACEYGVPQERMWRLKDGSYFCTTPKLGLTAESMCLRSALKDYVRIDEQGNEHPCGVLEVES